MQHCVAGSATTPWHCATHSHTADAPHPRKRTAEPSKGRRTTTPRPCKHNAVTSGRRNRSPPSPSALCDHPRRPRRHPATATPLQLRSGHCSAVPDAVKAHEDKTSPRPLLCLVRPPVSGTLESARGQQPDEDPPRHHPRSCSCTGTGLATTPQQEQDPLGQSSTPWHYTPCLHT
jgi:hypothetical protein